MHVGQPHSPRFIPHAQWCSSSPPSTRASGIIAGPSHAGAMSTKKNASRVTLATARRSGRKRGTLFV
jgi:hypothetical protein